MMTPPCLRVYIFEILPETGWIAMLLCAVIRVARALTNLSVSPTSVFWKHSGPTYMFWKHSVPLSSELAYFLVPHQDTSPQTDLVSKTG